MAEPVIEILSLTDRPTILPVIFRHQGLLRKSDCFNPNKGAEYKRAAIVEYAAIFRYTAAWPVEASQPITAPVDDVMQ